MVIDLNESKIGIVGGSGFIGASLARHLNKNYKVKILDKKSPPNDLKNKVEYESCDIRSFHDLERCLEDVSLVINTAIVQIPLINEMKRLGYEVNILGTQNVCEVVNQNPSIKGMILAGSWHVIGERGLRGTINEEFGFRPDKVEARARLYALCKISQEAIVRVYDEMPEKIYGVIRMGTVLGEGMSEKTAAAIFIRRGLEGNPLTPYKHSMYRPMLYVDVNDVCRTFEVYAKKIFTGNVCAGEASLSHIVNVYWPKPVSILELAEMIREAIVNCSDGEIKPRIEIADRGRPIVFTPEDKDLIKVDISKVKAFLGLERMTSPKETIERLVRERMWE